MRPNHDPITPGPPPRVKVPPHIRDTPPVPPGYLNAPPPGRNYLNPAELKRLHHFQFAAKLIVEGLFHGKHRSPYHDFSSEFADYRQYTPGDEIRAIDWRAYARTDRFYIKLYRKETDMSCTILVDKSSSMAFRGEGDELTKLEYASYLAAALAYLLVRQGDKAALALCDDKIRSYIAPGSTSQALKRVTVALERTVPGGPTQLAASLQALVGIVKRKGLLIVISDFLDDTDAIFSALGMFAHRGFSILLFHTLTNDELNLPATPNALFKDPESSLTIAAEPDSIRDAYQEEMQAFIRDMDTRAKARRIHYHLSSTSQPYHHALEAFLSAKSRF